MKVFSEKQPKDGETILLCGHGDEKHAFWNSCPVTFQRPDSTKGESNWIIMCEKCFLEFDLEGKKPEIREDKIWKGDEPEFYKIYQ